MLSETQNNSLCLSDTNFTLNVTFTVGVDTKDYAAAVAALSRLSAEVI